MTDEQYNDMIDNLYQHVKKLVTGGRFYGRLIDTENIKQLVAAAYWAGHTDARKDREADGVIRGLFKWGEND